MQTIKADKALMVHGKLLGARRNHYSFDPP